MGVKQLFRFKDWVCNEVWWKLKNDRVEPTDEIQDQREWVELPWMRRQSRSGLVQIPKIPEGSWVKLHDIKLGPCWSMFYSV